MSHNTDIIPFSRPEIGPEEEQAVLSVLRSGWITTGQETLQFEEEFASYAGTNFAIAVNSATAGLHLCLEALDLPKDSFVITSPYTFAASAEVIRYVGCHPLFVDIRRDSYNLDPIEVERAITGNQNRVSAILPVHMAGLSCEMNRLLELSRTFDIPVVEDAAHAFPVPTPTGLVGTHGDCGVYSFYANKPITTGEGGMIVTEKSNLSDRVKILRLHGIDRPAWDRFTTLKSDWEYDILAPGFKYNLTDLAAAIGRVQLKRSHAFLDRRRYIAKTYIRELRDCEFLTLPAYSDDHGWHLFLVRLDDSKTKLSRDELIHRLGDEGIGTSVHYKPLHMMTYYRNRYGYKDNDFPLAFQNFRQTISLPIYPSLKGDQILRIVKTIKKIG